MLHRGLKMVSFSAKITAWVFQVARNAIADYHRKRATAAGAIKKLAANVDDGLRAPHQGEATEKQAAEAIAELTTCMEPLVKELPEPYRRAIALTELDRRRVVVDYQRREGGRLRRLRLPLTILRGGIFISRIEADRVEEGL